MNHHEIPYLELADEATNNIDITTDEVFLIAEKDENAWENEEGGGPGNDDHEEVHVRTNIRKDLHNIIFLMFLYLLQGVPLGLAHSLPFIMSARNVSYADQGTFSFAFWPYAMKLLWAPLVDSIYVKKFGRRKSWLVPMQFIMGIFLISFADYVHQLLEVDRNEATVSKDIILLTIIFWVLTFFTATQDVAVDGWGLTILSKENVSWSSTCNSAGVTAGWFIGGVIFLIVQSADFSNKYFRPALNLPHQDYGIVTIDKFMRFFGVVFLISTLLIMIFKKETINDPHHKSVEDTLTLKQTYVIVWRILSLPSVRILGLILFTCRVPFALHHMVFLKLIEKGVPRENLGLLAVPLTPFEIVLPLIVSKFTNGPTPLKVYLNTYPIRILTSVSIALFVYLTPFFKNPDTGYYPFIFYVLCIVISIPNSAMTTTQSVAQVSFFTRVSDKTVGGTYMTLLNTISNLGANWPQTLILYLVHFFSVKQCSSVSKPSTSTQSTLYLNYTTAIPVIKSNMSLIMNNTCYTEADSKACTNLGGTCLYKIDAYYIMAFVCALVGLIWLIVFRKSVNHIQSLGKSSWKIKFI